MTRKKKTQHGRSRDRRPLRIPRREEAPGRGHGAGGPVRNPSTVRSIHVEGLLTGAELRRVRLSAREATLLYPTQGSDEAYVIRWAESARLGAVELELVLEG